MTKRKIQAKSKRAKPRTTATSVAGASKPPAQSKAAACIGLLSRKEGASVADLQKATGWQPHSVRGLQIQSSRSVDAFDGRRLELSLALDM